MAEYFFCPCSLTDWYSRSHTALNLLYRQSTAWNHNITHNIFGSNCQRLNRTMPVLTNGHLAQRLQENWMAAHNPRVEQLANTNTRETLDDSLTSLNWLQNLNMNYICGASTPPVSPPMRTDQMTREGMKVNPNQVLGTQSNHSHAYHDGRYGRLEYGNPHLQFEPINYRTNPYVKPPHSYASLICMAMKDCKKSKITLSAIYSWITDNFMYYRMADPSWQNSIRHNLSLNKCFEKVPRRKDEPGKGGFWRMNPNCNESVDITLPKKRKSSKKDNSDEPNSKKKSKKSKAAASEENSPADMFPTPALNRDLIGVGQNANPPNLFSALSPPASDENSTDFDDLLCADFSDTDCSIDNPLNLAVQGIKIEPPEWWTDSLTGAEFKGIFENSMNAMHVNTQANIPNSHPWSVNKSDIEEAIAALEDVDTLLYNHSLSNPAP